MASLFCSCLVLFTLWKADSGRKLGCRVHFLLSQAGHGYLSNMLSLSGLDRPAHGLNPTTETMLFKGTTMQKIHCQVNPGQAET